MSNAAEQSTTPEQPEAASTPPIAAISGDMPPVPEEIREAARHAPNHWLGMVDPTWSGDGPPPEWAVVGQWRSGYDGEIVEWRDNPEYRPSPTALGWPDPADDVDKAIQLASTGYGPGEAVTSALVALPEAAVYITSAGDPLSATAPDAKTPVVPVFTSPVHLHAAGRLGYALMSVPDLLDRLPEEHLLYVNPSAAVSMTVDSSALREALSANAADGSADETPASSIRPRTESGNTPGAAPVPSENATARWIEDVDSPAMDSLL